ncbi:ubiquitin-conjugating enzyme E2 5A-like [Triticum aestivum]|uniref:ubiquitin-conjugating enzyme E2 5A-like n=1 Tax=Triticum aestivum TaxID=4565 RepID=UPI00084443D4|nr:ubiquitin-conjugating enzyme E2 5A-like [Triticum aestivum]
MPEPAPVIRRIRKELKQLWMDPAAFCRPGATPVTDLFHWEVIIDGPHDSPYAGGTFPVDVAYPKDYPFKPIKLTFKTKMALDIFGRGWWPNLTIRTVLLSVVSVLYDPLLDLPVRHDAARLYKRERGLYDEKARRWTRRYASAPVVSFYPAGMELFEELLDEAAISGAVARRRSCGAGKWRFFGGRLLGAI